MNFEKENGSIPIERRKNNKMADLRVLVIEDNVIHLTQLTD